MHRARGHEGKFRGTGGMHPDWSDMTAVALTELQSLRAALNTQDTINAEYEINFMDSRESK